MRAVICAMLMALTVTAAIAEEDRRSANYLLPGCRWWTTETGSSPEMFFKAGLCAGKVEGIAFILDLGVVGVGLCADIPPGVTTAQEIRVVVAYIEARPNKTHEAFDRLAIEALREAWPCRD